MYSPAVIDLFARVKAVLDPDDVLNPGVSCGRRSSTRTSGWPPRPRAAEGLALAYRHDGGDFSAAVHRCTGVGKCRADLPARRVMCPSWPATREEKDTTRGRARVLQEMLAPGGPVNGWRAPEVHDALDLCLSCKGCSRDCPTGVDMATYKAEVLHQSYRRRLRPRPHYTLGRLPRWADLAARAPRGGERGAGLAARRAAGQVVGRHGPAPGGAAVRPADLPRAVGRPSAPARRRRAGGAVGGLVHRPLRAGGRVRGGARCWRPPATACRCPATTPAAG